MSATKGILQRNSLWYLMHCRERLVASSMLQSLKTSVGQKEAKISQIKILLMVAWGGFLVVLVLAVGNFSVVVFQKQALQNVKGYVWKMVHLEVDFPKETSHPKIKNRPNVTTLLSYDDFLCHLKQYFHSFICWQGRGCLQVSIMLY